MVLIRSVLDSVLLSGCVFFLVAILTGFNVSGQMPDIFFSPLGFGVICITFFLEIFGNRW